MLYKELKETVAKAVCAALGLAPESREAISMIRYAYQRKATTPQSGSSANVIYLALSQRPDPSSDRMETVIKSDASGAYAEVTTVTPYTLLCTCYGADAEDYADKLWHGMIADFGIGSAKDILCRAGITVILFPERPVSMPELEGTLWRRRTDVRFNLTMTCITKHAVDTVEQPPEITIQTRKEDANAD